jgi:hypothetical protein
MLPFVREFINLTIDESKPHSNLWGKHLIYSNEALHTDHIGYYSQEVLVTGKPSVHSFHEEYPHQTRAWVYDHYFLNG